METFKTILLIAFIVGIVGAINAIVTQSQNPNTPSAIVQLSKILGLAPKTPTDTGRALNYVPSLLKPQTTQTTTTTNQNTQASSNTNSNNNNTTRTFSIPTPRPTPTPSPSAAQLPSLPPIQANAIPTTMGVKDTQLPPLPPLAFNTANVSYPTTVPSPQSSPTKPKIAEKSVYDTVINFLGETYHSFGF